MNNNISKTPIPNCEPIKSYAPGTKESRRSLWIEYQKSNE